MVVLNVKRDQTSLFLFETQLNAKVSDVLGQLVQLHNGRLKVLRLCMEVEGLAEHGIEVPGHMKGLLEDQIKELKLSDENEERCSPEGGWESNPDPVQKRSGRAPKKEMREVLEKTVHKAKEIISADKVKENKASTFADVRECLDVLRGAAAIVYPMGLPEYDPVRMELENREELQPNAARDVLDGTEATLWFANKEMKRDECLSKYFGKNEKTKVIVKLSTKKLGQPTSESWMDQETQKRLMAENFKRMEELKRLEKDEDDSYLNSAWADGSALKKRFQGLDNISWK